jgi:hypothetical protein
MYYILGCVSYVHLSNVEGPPIFAPTGTGIVDSDRVGDRIQQQKLLVVLGINSRRLLPELRALGPSCHVTNNHLERARAPVIVITRVMI